jgi:imidazole glycerol phosphate synthase subunit HisF
MNKKLVVMPCLDMIAGRVVKGVHFEDIKDAGDPVACCRAYCEAGADELAMLDITATVEKRRTLVDVTKRVAEAATVPFTMGGGIRSPTPKPSFPPAPTGFPFRRPPSATPRSSARWWRRSAPTR